ncbi:MAG TPA: M14 family zinc carboxypeptidase [Actinomycetes bacterium]|nr:M14 family zinc carboxypeptidase [Actinomycetes bacterium]
MPYPRSAGTIEAELGAIAGAFPDTCAITPLPNATHNGRQVWRLEIGKAVPGGPARRVVVITGGLHAREWAPPDALVSLAGRLLTAYDNGTPLPIPAHTDLSAQPTPVTYPATQLPDDDVRRIIERLDIHLVALANPDGRAVSQAHKGNALWRKNRRPATPPSTCKGVDVNRNFPVPPDFTEYYSAAAEAYLSASKDPCQFHHYVGQHAAEEPEVKALMGLIGAGPVDYLVDAHAYSRLILFPWGIDGLGIDPLQHWREQKWNRSGVFKGRDGKPGGPYDEFFPNADPDRLLDAHRLVGGLMRDAILRAAGADPRAVARSRYSVQPSADIYPAPGMVTDWALSLNLVPGTLRPLHAFVIEFGSEENLEGGYWPPVQHFPKIEREIHLAILALLSHAASLPPP